MMSLLILSLCLTGALGYDFSYYYFYQAPGSSSIKNNITVVKDKGDAPKGYVYMCSAAFSNSLTEIGWDQLTVEGNLDQLKSKVFEERVSTWYAAGYAEGYTTAESIHNVFLAQDYNYTKEAAEFIEKHYNYMWRNGNASRTDKYWEQVFKQLMMMEGIAEGFNARSNGKYRKITGRDVFRINFGDEYEDVRGKTNPNLELARSFKKKMMNDHCSALIKVTDNEVFFSQVTWAGYQIFVGRQYKTYKMETTVSMTGNAGIIASGDDYYITSNRLGIMETTNGIYNASLYKLIKPECVSEFMRVMVGTFMANSSSEWVRLYSREPSGTYCNQWMVFDYKLYKVGMKPKDLPRDIFWLAEEIPGHVVGEDMTETLRKEGYWASYNIPYFEIIYNISGFYHNYKTTGDFWSWKNCPRAQIFRRDNHKVVDLKSMQRMMRYNDYKNDPLSIIQNCSDCMPKYSALLAIASRGDLVDPYATFGNFSLQDFFRWSPFGADDAKITSNNLIKTLTSSVEQGPTHDQQPFFKWSEFPGNPTANLSGMLQEFNFKFVSLTYAEPPTPPSSGESKRVTYIIVSIVTIVVVVSFIFSIVYTMHKKRTEKVSSDYRTLN